MNHDSQTQTSGESFRATGPQSDIDPTECTKHTTTNHIAVGYRQQLAPNAGMRNEYHSGRTPETPSRIAESRYARWNRPLAWVSRGVRWNGKREGQPVAWLRVA